MEIRAGSVTIAFELYARTLQNSHDSPPLTGRRPSAANVIFAPTSKRNPESAPSAFVSSIAAENPKIRAKRIECVCANSRRVLRYGAAFRCMVAKESVVGSPISSAPSGRGPQSPKISATVAAEGRKGAPNRAASAISVRPSPRSATNPVASRYPIDSPPYLLNPPSVWVSWVGPLPPLKIVGASQNPSGMRMLVLPRHLSSELFLERGKSDESRIRETPLGPSP